MLHLQLGCAPCSAWWLLVSPQWVVFARPEQLPIHCYWVIEWLPKTRWTCIFCVVRVKVVWPSAFSSFAICISLFYIGAGTAAGARWTQMNEPLVNGLRVKQIHWIPPTDVCVYAICHTKLSANAKIPICHAITCNMFCNDVLRLERLYLMNWKLNTNTHHATHPHHVSDYARRERVAMMAVVWVAGCTLLKSRSNQANKLLVAVPGARFLLLGVWNLSWAVGKFGNQTNKPTVTSNAN